MSFETPKSRCRSCQEWVSCISHICDDCCCWTWRPRTTESVIDDKTFGEALESIERRAEEHWQSLNWFQRFLLRKERKRYLASKQRLAELRAQSQAQLETWWRDPR